MMSQCGCKTCEAAAKTLGDQSRQGCDDVVGSNNRFGWAGDGVGLWVQKEKRCLGYVQDQTMVGCMMLAQWESPRTEEG